MARFAGVTSNKRGRGDTPAPANMPAVMLQAVGRAVETPPTPSGLDGLMDLEAVANYAGIHPTTLRRWMNEDRIPQPVKRYRRKLYWTEDDAWTIKCENLPGDYHSEIVEPAERNSADSGSKLIASQEDSEKP